MARLYQNNIKKIVLTILFLAFLTFITVLLEQKEQPYYFYTNNSRFVLYFILAVATIFTIHSWVLLPKYFDNKIREYKLWYIGSVNAFVLFVAYHLIRLTDIEDVNMLFFFVALVICVAFLLFVNTFYTLFFDRTHLVEFIINSVVLASVFYLIVGSNNEAVYALLVALLVFYVHTFVIVPLFLKKKKWKYFLLVVNLSIFYWVSLYFITLQDKYSYWSLEAIVLTALSLAIILFLSFIYGYYRVKFKNTTIEVETKTSELNLLKSQVNPHFLFNTLNTLYASALNENAPQTAEITSKLANLLRYMENDMKKEYIPITDEIKYIEDYIAIQKTRCAVEPKIAFTTQNLSESIRISPGLLIPLVENAFKHGVHLIENSKLKMEVSCDAKNIRFTCANSYNESLKVNKMEKGFGIGLQNVRKRLELFYGQNHTFEIDKNNDTFTVKLIIPRK